MLQPLGLVYRGAKIELENVREYDMPWSRRLWLYRHGFTSSRGVFYDLSEETVRDYVNDVQHQKAYLKQYELNNKEVTSNKLLFHLLLARSHPDRIPELIAVWDPNHGVRDVPGQTVDSVDDLLSTIENRRVVVKPKKGWAGREIHVLDHDGDRPLFDGEPVTERELIERLGAQPESILTEYVNQAAYAERIYPGASNTLRILIMVDPETDEPFIAAAIHRFGTESSGHVDNWSSGGLSVHLDADTGELGKAAASPKGNGFERLTHHPDTDARIAGTEIPGWEEVREGVLEVADDYSSMLRYVGWDVIVTGDDGSFVIVEGNSASDLDLIQTHEPLLTDDRVRRFYRHHGIL